MGVIDKIKGSSAKRQQSNPGSPTSDERNSSFLGSNSPTKVQHALQQRKQFATEGYLNFRLLAFAGGLAVICTSIESLSISIYESNYLRILLYLYTLCFGWIICLLEGQFIRLESIQNARGKIIEFVPVFKYLYGRGIFYVISAILQFSEHDPANILSGIFLVGVGVMFIIIGWHTKRRLTKLKKLLKDPRKVRKQFRKYDKDGDNYLDKDEFGQMIVGITAEEMDEDELEGAFAVMDTKNQGIVTLEEFTAWFQGFEGNEKDEETGGYDMM